MSDTEDEINFLQGKKNIGEKNVLKNIKQKISELSNIKNVSFFLGAGASSDAILCMKDMQEKIAGAINNGSDEEIKDLYQTIDSNNLEKTLSILHARKNYLQGIKNTEPIETLDTKKRITKNLIETIEELMYSEINIDFSSDKSIKILDLYKQFYQKVALRNKDLSRINIFTTNNDLFNEKALDTLNINYNNGFGGGLEKVFNPARFHYTFSKKIDANLEKFEPLENMVYLYKLHGSISWVEQEGNSLFDIHEVSVTNDKSENNQRHVLIYPTPLKQAQSLGTPYADLLREFQTKLSQPNSVIFIIGYSFGDVHINNIIYQSLTSNSSMSVVIFGEHKNCKLVEIDDSRIYRIFGTTEGKEIHYFEYIVEELLPNTDKNIDTKLLTDFISSIKKLKGDSTS